jgi:hypothetical protein
VRALLFVRENVVHIHAHIILSGDFGIGATAAGTGRVVSGEPFLAGCAHQD